MIRTVTQWMEQHMTDRPKISIFLRPAHNLVHTTTMGPTRVGRKAGVWVTGKSWMAQRETDIPAPSQVTASTDWETWVMVTCIFWGKMTQQGNLLGRGEKKDWEHFLLHWKFLLLLLTWLTIKKVSSSRWSGPGLVLWQFECHSRTVFRVISTPTSNQVIACDPGGHMCQVLPSHGCA